MRYTSPVRTFGLWALGGAMTYLILRELSVGTRRRALTGAGPTTPSTLPPFGDRDIDRSNGDLDGQLDAAVDATFPASDAISMQFE
jgi:hypothetical protein